MIPLKFKTLFANHAESHLSEELNDAQLKMFREQIVPEALHLSELVFWLEYRLVTTEAIMGLIRVVYTGDYE